MASTTRQHHDTHEAGHPSPSVYVRIALVLLTITIVEVAIVYMGLVSGLLVPLLLVLSAGKFALVVGYYMHLKFDNRLLSALFIGGLLLALAVSVAIMALFDAFYYPSA